MHFCIRALLLWSQTAMVIVNCRWYVRMWALSIKRVPDYRLVGPAESFLSCAWWVWTEIGPRLLLFAFTEETDLNARGSLTFHCNIDWRSCSEWRASQSTILRCSMLLNPEVETVMVWNSDGKRVRRNGWLPSTKHLPAAKHFISSVLVWGHWSDGKLILWSCTVADTFVDKWLS